MTSKVRLGHFLSGLDFVFCILCLVTQSCPTLCDPMDCSPPGSSATGASPGKNTGVGCDALLQGIFLTQGSNPGLLHSRWILHHLSHKGSPRILEWIAYPFSRESSQPRSQTRVSCFAGGFLTSWATREALYLVDLILNSTDTYHFFHCKKSYCITLVGCSVFWNLYLDIEKIFSQRGNKVQLQTQSIVYYIIFLASF